MHFIAALDGVRLAIMKVQLHQMVIIFESLSSWLVVHSTAGNKIRVQVYRLERENPREKTTK